MMRRYNFLVYCNGCADGVAVAAEAKTEREARERIKAFYGKIEDLVKDYLMVD